MTMKIKFILFVMTKAFTISILKCRNHALENILTKAILMCAQIMNYLNWMNSI